MTKTKSTEQIHTGTNYTNYGDGFFSLWNPNGYTDKLEITSSNLETQHRNKMQVNTTLGLFQCIQV